MNHIFLKDEPLRESQLTAADRAKLKDSDFGIPETRSFPLHDETHVRAAISMFRKAPPARRKALASKIRAAAKKFKIELGPDALK